MPQTRRASESDFDLLVELYLNEIEQNHENARTFASDLITRMKTILAFKNKKLCGTISWEIRGGLDDGVGEIAALGVNEEYRRQGIAKLLVDQVISDASELFAKSGNRLRVLFLFMESRNETARSFYNRIGFNEVASIESFYPNDGASILIRRF